jgi:alpha-beta hydrolase superfamily lysophospholipase
MDSDSQIMTVTKQIQSNLAKTPWTRAVAAGSLITGAVLLITGRRKSALAVAAAGAAVALLENPDMVRDAWESMPRLVRTSQDFLSRIEEFVEELNKQGIRLRKVISAD